MSKDSILIIDSNEAFATILKEGLEQGGEYRTTLAHSGDEALRALDAAEFALVIVDLGLDDPDGVTFARTLREQRPNLRMMLIPLMGEDLPSELADLDIQGVLSKPFFFPELPGIIGRALGRDMDEEPAVEEVPPVEEAPPIAEAPPVAAPPPVEAVKPAVDPAARLAEVCGRISEKRMKRITQAMDRLAEDIGAEAVILSCEGGLIARSGRLSDEEASGLAQVVGENWRTSARVARILGQEQLRFEQSIEGGEHMFYSLAVAEDIILSAALSTHAPLGMIRHSAKTTADKLRSLVGQ
jgi:CheY-like chemotaxis protein